MIQARLLEAVFRAALKTGMLTLVTFWPAVSSLALPKIDHRIELKNDLDSSPQNTVVVFADDEVPEKFWHIPYKAVLAKKPITHKPWIAWTPDAAAPKLQFSIQLEPFESSTQEYLLKKLTQISQLGLKENLLVRIPLSQSRVSLGGSSGDIWRPGKWQLQSDLMGWTLSDTLELSPDENESLQQLDAAGQPLFFNVEAQIEGTTEPKTLSRKYVPNCVMQTLLKDRSLSDVAGKNLSPMLFLSARIGMQSACVLEESWQGSGLPNLEETLLGWEQELLNQKVLKREGGSWRFGTDEELSEFVNSGPKERTFVSVFPKAKGTFSVGFATTRVFLSQR